MEGTEPKMPGAPKGIQIMTPQQFVAKAGDMPGEESEEGVAEASPETTLNLLKGLKSWQVVIMNNYYRGKYSDYSGRYYYVLATSPEEARQVVLDNADAILQDLLSMKSVNGRKILPRSSAIPITDKRIGDIKDGTEAGRMSTAGYKKMFSPQGVMMVKLSGGAVVDVQGQEQGVAEGSEERGQNRLWQMITDYEQRAKATKNDIKKAHYLKMASELRGKLKTSNEQGVAEDDAGDVEQRMIAKIEKEKQRLAKLKQTDPEAYKREMDKRKTSGRVPPVSTFEDQGVAEDQEHLERIRKLSGLDEATKLPASSREFGGDEFQDYMKRIVGTPDIDKKTGQVKTDKKGNEKYVSGKTKSDRYKMPYIHRSSVIEYLSPDGKTYDEDLVKKTLAIRPKALLKQNEKMKHSNGEFEQFFNVGFAALTGIALDEETNNLIIVNTCPGAGSCKVDCFAMKGGKVQFQGPWQSDGRILTYLLNDPDGFFNQLSAEITKESEAGKKGDKKFPNGWQTTVRWHDAGDFFSPEYLDLALKMAAKHPDVKFYAYTKMAGAALAKKPANFIINWSEGAHTSQEKQVKASDANLDTTKNSRIVPDELFQDLLVKDEKKNLVKGAQGQWQVQPNKLPELKQRLAKQYGLSANSILDYNEYMAKRKSIPAGMKYNVIVAPGEGDISANDPNIISTLLLKH